MAERNMLFTWDLQSFNENLNQSNDLLPLHHEFVNRNFPLSRSLLMWEKDSGNWSLVDFVDKKVYHFEINDNKVEVSQEVGGLGLMETSPANLLSLHRVYGTHEGFIDWLLIVFNQVTFDRSGIDNLKRTDLSGKRLSFETVHPDLLAVYEMLQEILTAPREWLIGLSKDNVQQVKNNLQQLLDRFLEIQSFDSQTSREQYKRVLQEILVFCDDAKQLLGPIVAYLKSKRAEQLETQVNANVANTVTDAVEKLNAETDRLQKQSDQVEQLKNQMENLLAEESVSKHEKIFEEQANKHKQVAFWWLLSTVGLIIGFGFIFYWLFNALKLGGTELVGVLQNIFTKGFFLSLGLSCAQSFD